MHDLGIQIKQSIVVYSEFTYFCLFVHSVIHSVTHSITNKQNFCPHSVMNVDIVQQSKSAIERMPNLTSFGILSVFFFFVFFFMGGAFRSHVCIIILYNIVYVYNLY